MSFQIIDVETGANLPPEQEGEICGMGPGLMKGYLKNPEATAECIDAEGWFHTGDLGLYTSNGAIFITGRMKELMKLDNHQVRNPQTKTFHYLENFRSLLQKLNKLSMPYRVLQTSASPESKYRKIRTTLWPSSSKTKILMSPRWKS